MAKPSLWSTLLPLPFVALLSGAGCSSGAGDSVDPPPPGHGPLVRSEGCVKTRCEAARDACWDDVEACESTCVSGSIDSLESCYAVCRSIDCPPCSSRDDACAVHGYLFEVVGEPNPDVEAACERAFAEIGRCVGSYVEADCRHLARVVSARGIRAFECVAEAPCDGPAPTCDALLPESDFGQRLCMAFERVCGIAYCDAETVERLDGGGQWLRSDVTEAAMSCLTEPCDKAAACVDAWREAVLPSL